MINEVVEVINKGETGLKNHIIIFVIIFLFFQLKLIHLYWNICLVAVSCKSGRGRSGTFSAIVGGILKEVTNMSSLVDLIVTMRGNLNYLI